MMDDNLYPPRFQFVVQADSEYFFHRPRTVIVHFHGIVKTDNSEVAPCKIVIPAIGTYACSYVELFVRVII